MTGKRAARGSTSDEQRRGAWANRQVGTRVQSRYVYGWTLAGARRGHVLLFTNHACTEHIEVLAEPRS